jgi:oxaloacetate decarboxylase beta subunit
LGEVNFFPYFYYPEVSMDFLLGGVLATTWKELVMYGVGIILIYLAIRKKLEPSLLLPMGFGAILVNLPFSGAVTQFVEGIGPVQGILDWLFSVGIESAEMMPLLLFVGIGAMIDFGPLLSNPKLILFGAAAQWGIFATISVATLMGFSLADAASIGIIGAADGPTSILVSQVLKSSYVGPIAIAAYSYMALVPIIQPFAIKLVTTKKERMIRMSYNPKAVSKKAKIFFPIIVTIVAGYIAPASVSLVGLLMFGNLIRESTVLDSLSETAQTALVNLITLLLGITIASTMKAQQFVRLETLMIMLLGLLAFVFDTIGGVLFAKLLNLFTRKKVNPMLGAAGISAFPMSARVIQRMGQEADPQNHLLMHAVGANVAGQIASVIAGGVILGLVPTML